MADRTSTEIAADTLRAMIFAGELAPGSDHLEAELATRLGLSRTPVREAALQLAAQGLVRMRPRKGLRVTALSPADMAEVYDVLTELESLAAADAARAGYGAHDLEPLAATIADMDRALVADDLDAWAGADEGFHGELVRLGGNSRVIAIAAMMTDQVRRARTVTLHLRPRPDKSNADHRAVLDAIARGDAAAAHRIHHAHRRHARDLLLGFLERYRVASL